MFPNALRIRSLHGLGSLLQDFKVQYAAFYEDCEATFDFPRKFIFPGAVCCINSFTTGTQFRRKSPKVMN